MFDTMLIANKIKEARIAKNMTQLMLADEMGVSYQAVSNWERGNSMPDIGKVEQLCKVLGLNLEELLGTGKETETIKKVMDEDAEISIEEIAEVAEMIPPKRTEVHVTVELQKEGDMDIAAIAGVAPFLSKEVLDQIAEKMSAENIGALPAIAPFVSREVLDRIAENVPIEQGGVLPAIAPFVSGKVLDRVLEKIPAENLKDAAGLFPFLSDETLGRIAEKILAGEDGLKKISMLAPFLGEEMLGKIVLEKLKNK